VPTLPQPIVQFSDECFTHVSVECIPPIDPADPEGERFENCDSINVAPTECTERVTLLSFRYYGGDCSSSNNIQDPNTFRCDDFFGGPPDEDEVGGEPYLIITDSNGLGLTYYDGPIVVGDEFNISNIVPDTFIAPNVNASIYNGEPSFENLRQTMVFNTACTEVTFLKDRYGALELIGFANPSQGYHTSIVPVSFNITILNIAEGFNTSIDALSSVTTFPPPNDFLNFTERVVGKVLGPGEQFSVSSNAIKIDLSIPNLYIVYTTAITSIRSSSEGLSLTGFSCLSRSSTNFTAGVTDTGPTSAPVIGAPTAP
jgi:hypothetical protein